MTETTRRAEQARLLYEQFVAGDFESLERRLHPEVEFVNPTDAVEPGTRSGPAAFVRALGKLHDMFDYDGFELTELVEREDRVVVMVRFFARGRGSDLPVDAQFAHLLAWDGDRIRRLEWFRTRDEAVAALG